MRRDILLYQPQIRLRKGYYEPNKLTKLPNVY